MIKRPYMNDYCEKCKHHYLLDGDESRCEKARLGGLGVMIHHAMCAQIVICDDYEERKKVEQMKVNIQDAINCVNVDLNETTCENCRLFGLDYSVCAEVDKIKLEALEKQIPKKPTDISKVRDGEGYIYLIGKCPCCAEILEEDTVYCDCGQKLDWGD